VCRLKRLVGPIEIRHNRRAVAEGEAKIWVDEDRVLDGAQRGMVVATKHRQRQPGKIQRPGIIAAGGDCLPRHMNPFLETFSCHAHLARSMHGKIHRHCVDRNAPLLVVMARRIDPAAADLPCGSGPLGSCGKECG
jgi:hypothetical protein